MSRYPHQRKHDYDLLAELWFKGLSMYEIAERMETTTNVVCMLRQRLGLPARQRRHGDKHDQEIRHLWRKGADARAISEAINMPLPSVYKQMQRLGLSRRKYEK